MSKTQNWLDYLFNLLEISFIWLFDTFFHLINILIIFIINLIIRIIKYLFKISVNKVKTFKLPSTKTKTQSTPFDYSLQEINDIMPYLYSNPDNYNINLESIEKLCNQITKAYEITIEDIKNKTYFIYDGFYFLNKIVCVADIDNLTIVEKLAQKLRNVEGLQPLARLILSTIMKRRMSQNKAYTIGQIQGLYTQLDTLHQVDSNTTLTQRNEDKNIIEVIKPKVNKTKVFSIICYGFLFIITIIFLIKPW